MITIGICIFIITAILVLDLILHRDLLSPILLILGHGLLIFMIPAFFKVYFRQTISFVPEEVDQTLVSEYTCLYILLSFLTFAIFFLISKSWIDRHKLPNFSIDFKSKYHFFSHQLLSIGSFFILMMLVPYNIWGGSAYYNMSGYGAINWLANITLFGPAFLFLASSRHRYWSYPAMFMSIFLASFLLSRGTQTAYMFLCSFIILRETYKIRLRSQIIFFVFVPLIIILPKFLIILSHNETTFKKSLIWFVTFDLGRFDYLASAIYYKLEGLQISNATLFRYIPFANYLPVVKDINESFQALPEQLYMGKRLVNVGGIPFTTFGEAALILGHSGMAFLYSIWGIIFGGLYSLTRSSKNPYILGFYALFLYSARGLAFTGLIAIMGVLIFLLIFCKIQLREPEKR